MNLDFNAFWLEQGQDLSDKDQQALACLRQILDLSANPLAQFLSGRSPYIPFEPSHARALEEEILLQLDGKKTPQQVAQQLLCLLRARECLDSRGVRLPKTRIALPTETQSSPFSATHMRQAAIAYHWRTRLLSWSDTTNEPSAKHLSAACLLSSILLGGLLDRTHIRNWMSRLHQPLTFAGPNAYVEFRKSFRGHDQAFLRRWFLDPISESFFARLNNQPLAYFKQPKEFILAAGEILSINGSTIEEIPVSISQLTDYAASLLSVNASQVDVRYAQGKIKTHSLRPDVWHRLMGCEPPGSSEEAPAAANSLATSSSDLAHSDQWISSAPWYFAIRRLLLPKPAPADLRIRLQAILTNEPESSIAHFYAAWLEAMLTENAASKKPIQPSTAYRYFDLVTGQLLGILGSLNPAERTSEDLARRYKAILLDTTPGERKILSKGIREFQTFLERHHGGIPFWEIEDILGDEAALHPVDANMVTEEEFRKTLQWLKAKAKRGKKRHLVARAIQALTLLYRSGCRRREIFFLRICDVHVFGQTEILIRPHDLRTLKSDAATRKPSISAFLSGKERRQLKDLYARRLRETGGNPFSEALLFGELAEEAIPVIEISNLIMEGLRKVTRDSEVHLHILRHSHGTLTELALRAIDWPMAISAYDLEPTKQNHLKLTYQRLRNNARQRALLIGSGESSTRAAGFAAARMLGHSSPGVSWEHYLHHADLILYGVCCANLPKLSGAHYSRLSGLPESTISESRTQKSEHYPIPALRRKYASRFIVSSPIAAVKGKPGRPVEFKHWTPLESVRQILEFWNEGQRDIEQLSVLTSAQPEAVATIIATAKNYYSAQGQNDDLDLIPVPPPPKGDRERAFRIWLEERLQTSMRKRPDVTRNALWIHVRNFQKDYQDVAFKGQKEFAVAKTYLRLLRALGIEDQYLRLVIRSAAEDETLEEIWRQKLSISNATKTIFRPKNNGRNAYREWLGIQILDSVTGEARLKVTFNTIILAAFANPITIHN